MLHEQQTNDSLTPLFRPRAVAVIGASRDKLAIGYRLLECLQGGGYKGTIIPVNPHATELAGLKAVPTIEAIATPVDLAIIAVPPEAVLSVIDQCGAKRIPAAILITAGFSETGFAGASLQQALRERIRRYGIRLIGPNCMGVMNVDPEIRLNATFTPVVPPPGRVGFASESGGFGLAVVMAAPRVHLGLSTFVSVGNHADITVNDLLEYWEQDPATGVILLYLETIVDPPRFSAIATRVGRRKPIIVMKAGQTSVGQSAAGSHTAALATNETAVDAMLRQCGVIRASTVDEFISLAVGYSSQPLPRGRRIGILTNSGGPGVVCADSCASEGLLVAPLSNSTQAALSSILPRTAALKNPVDMIGFATEDQHANAVEAMLSEKRLDALIIIHVSVRPADNPPVAAGIIRGIRAGRQAGGKDKPVLICWMAEGDLESAFEVDGEVVPAFKQPEMPAKVLSRGAEYDEWRRQPAAQIPRFPDADIAAARALCTKALSERSAGWLTTGETYALLAAVKLPMVKGSVATGAEQAVEAASAVGFPVAVKLASHRIVHKSDIGAVRLDLRSAEDVRAAYETIRRRLLQDNNLEAMEGVLVQPMQPQGVEVAAGMSRDPLFGPMIAFGLGGIHIEVLADVQFRLSPLTTRDTSEMVRRIRGHRLLTGYRGHPPADLDAIEELLCRLSYLAERIPEITELDLNPVFALPDRQGCRIVDARIRVQSPPA